MGLIDHNIATVLTVMKRRLEGSLSREDYHDMLAGVRELSKGVNQVLAAATGECKHGKKFKNYIEDKQLITNGAVIDVQFYVSTETVSCPDQDKVISRLQCKDYSERTGHLSTCQSCPNFEATRKLMAQANKPELTQETSQGMLS